MSRINFGMWAAMAMILVPLAAAQSYTITDLGTLPSGNSSYASAINDQGIVVGQASYSSTISHAFSWTISGGMRDLGTYPGDVSSYAAAINGVGDIVGTSYGSGSPAPEHAVIWRHTGELEELGSLGGTTASAYGVNDFGAVTGNSALDDGTDHAFLWTPTGGMQDLGTLATGLNNSFGQAINNAGEVVGFSDLGQFSGSADAFVWTQAGGMQDLGGLGGTYSSATAINASGTVVGFAYSKTTEGGFVWTRARGMQPLNAGPGNALLGINESNQMVGLNYSGDIPFLWTKALHTQTLQNLIPPNSGWVLSAVGGINKVGQIVVSGTINGAYHAALLTPIN